MAPSCQTISWFSSTRRCRTPRTCRSTWFRAFGRSWRGWARRAAPPCARCSATAPSRTATPQDWDPHPNRSAGRWLMLAYASAWTGAETESLPPSPPREHCLAVEELYCQRDWLVLEASASAQTGSSSPGSLLPDCQGLPSLHDDPETCTHVPFVGRTSKLHHSGLHHSGSGAGQHVRSSPALRVFSPTSLVGCKTWLESGPGVLDWAGHICPWIWGRSERRDLSSFWIREINKLNWSRTNWDPAKTGFRTMTVPAWRQEP